MEYVESGSEEERIDIHRPREHEAHVVPAETRPARNYVEIRQNAAADETGMPQSSGVTRGRAHRTRPAEPTARIEQFYGVKRTTDERPAEKSRSKHTRHRPHDIRIANEEKSGLEPRISYVDGTGTRRRRSGRHYALTPGPTTPQNHGLDQNSNEMLDDYYDGFDDTLLPHTTSAGLNHEYGPGYVPAVTPMMAFGAGSPEYVGQIYPDAPFDPFGRPPQGPPPRPPRPAGGYAFSPSPERPDRIHSRPSGRPGKRYDYIMQAPHKTAIWDRAAVWNKTEDKYDLQLRLVLTRHGERYSSENFSYRSGTWTDIVFARKLNEQYRSLKTAKVGIVQKLTAYKKISFVYFIQFHAFPDVRYPTTGAWLRTDRKPITFRDNPMTRNSFMNQLRRLCTRRSVLYSTFTGTPREVDERPQIRWVSRLDELIEAGAVIDIDVKETFDSTKIYMGLFIAITISLGAALGYGFAMDNDFSTGFSIASWVITALGFFAAVIAAGEYLGLDSPKATLMDADGRERPWY